MKAAVENWLRWHKKLRSGIQFNLVIERIRIGTEWYSRLHWPDVVVSVKVGTQEKKSEEFVDLKVETEYNSNEDNHLVTRKQLPQTLGPFTWRYGSDDITVRMLNTEITQSYEKSRTANEEKYNISFLQGRVAVHSEFYIHARIEPVSSEDRTPNSAIFPDYND